MRENLDMKHVLMEELSCCSDYEMKIILSVVKSLRYTLRSEQCKIVSDIYDI